jgi:hypothetical protein
VTFELTNDEDRARGYFIVRAEVFTDHEDQHSHCPKATGLAFEIEGGAGPNRTSALENAETSAIGRALANCGYAKSKKRASASEMNKVNNNQVPNEFISRVEECKEIENLGILWDEAKALGFSQQVNSLITRKKKELS